MDIYESLTGARAYREPVTPDKACFTLARLAGKALNPALVKAFVSIVTFFPIGTVVRTTLGELGVSIKLKKIEYDCYARLDDRETVEGYLQRCVFDESVSLDDMESHLHIEAYLKDCVHEGLWRFLQNVLMIFIER